MQAYNLLPYILNVKTESCTNYCSSRPYTAGPTTSGSTNYCNCLPNYIWTISTQSCVSTFTDCASSNLEICLVLLIWSGTTLLDSVLFLAVLSLMQFRYCQVKLMHVPVSLTTFGITQLVYTIIIVAGMQ